jgi:hypothetical protein
MTPSPEERREREIIHMDYLLRQVQANGETNIRDAAVTLVDGMQSWRIQKEPAVANAILYGLVKVDHDAVVGPVFAIEPTHVPEGHPKQ